MPITRDPDFPPEAAELMMAFNRCADGHDVSIVFEAAANMLVSAIKNYATVTGGNRDTAIAMAATFAELLPDQIRFQWDRQRQDSDIVVPRGGN